MPASLEDRRANLRAASTLIHGHGPVALPEELARVSRWCESESVDMDAYGEGEALQAFEARVAGLLGCERARFFPSGTMAQVIALRIWSDRAGLPMVGMHPTCHLELHEEHAYRHLHGLNSVLVGPTDRPMLARDLAAVDARLSSLVVELPTRENGGQLPSWEELVELSSAARDRDIRLHLDGARLWEAQVSYGRPFPEICSLFDSVYVSFYKGIGALAGAMLAGPADFVDDAIVWQRRHGGVLYSMQTHWASAAMRLDDQLARIPIYRERAIDLARRLAAIDGIEVIPDPPHVNMFHIILAIGPDEAEITRDRVAEDTGLWIFSRPRPEDDGRAMRFELYVGEAALAIPADEIAGAFARLMRLAKPAGG